MTHGVRPMSPPVARLTSRTRSANHASHTKSTPLVAHRARWDHSSHTGVGPFVLGANAPHTEVASRASYSEVGAFAAH